MCLCSQYIQYTQREHWYIIKCNRSENDYYVCIESIFYEKRLLLHDLEGQGGRGENGEQVILQGYRIKRIENIVSILPSIA